MKALLTANAIALLPFATGTISPGTEVDVRMMPTNELMKVEEEPNTSVQNLKLAAGERVSAAFKASSVIIAVE